VIRPVPLLILSLILSGCASASTTHSWSCRATGADVCASIATIDRRPESQAATKPSQAIFGGHVASWWSQNRPVAETAQDAPRRESDQAMRIVIAPYIDGQGDYHDRADVYAVMRKAQWWIAPPAPVAKAEVTNAADAVAATVQPSQKDGVKP
jgi:conjugal transfer pilus assembly protein TraV